MAHQYECILLGATGYTGKWTAEYITTHLPTDFKWAIAGRSEAKLKNLVDELRSLNQDRQAPGIEVVQLQHNELLQLVKKTKVLITTVGPYHKYGEVALQACAETGTHYLDVTGEVPWVLEMTQKYHETAKRTGAIIIPQNGVESAPADLMCWKLASLIRERFSQGTGELVFTIHDMSVAASGGTLATALGLFDTYSFQQLAKSQDPYCLSLDASSQKGKKRPIMETLAGVRTVSGLGTLTDSIQGPADIPIIHRSRSLYGDKLYGENFYVTAYMRARNAVTAFGFHILFMAAMLAITLSPVRWLMKQFVYAPGDGPSKEAASREYVEWRAIANADTGSTGDVKQAYGKFRWQGSMYHLTGVTSAEAALILAREKTFANELGGGILTPSTLGQTYLDRLQKAGLNADFKVL